MNLPLLASFHFFAPSSKRGYIDMGKLDGGDATKSASTSGLPALLQP
jgi:hypothetical protein